MKLGGSLERRRGRRRFRGAQPDRSGLLAWVTRGVLLTGGALVVFGWLLGYLLSTQVLFPAPPPPGDLFEVPDLRGLALATARERLAGSRLMMGTLDSLQHPSVANGLILGQSPLPGQVARAGSPVRLTVSLGPQRRAVPDVVRLDADRARIVLETSGFLVSTASAESELPRGRVVEVSPPPDSVVALPARVTIRVSTGPPVVTMPLVLGMQEQEALMLLDSLGLVVADVEEVFRFGRDQGIVVEQEPASDMALQRGSPVRLKVGRRGQGGGNDDREQ
ncbi:MAG TPA: PASTA domain-containing protein [Longimicrobiales bacterium]|nr:PASTA domain-containing protein [Longimicrobiales bacterium]